MIISEWLDRDTDWILSRLNEIIKNNEINYQDLEYRRCIGASITTLKFYRTSSASTSEFRHQKGTEYFYNQDLDLLATISASDHKSVLMYHLIDNVPF